MRSSGLVAKAAAAVAVLVGGVFVIYESPANAQVASGGRNDEGISAGASDGAGTGGTPAEPVSTRKRRAPAPTCTADDGSEGRVQYHPVPESLLTKQQKEQVAAGGGRFYTKFCGEQAAPKAPGTGFELTYVPPSGPSAPPVDPVGLASDALQRTPLPEPQITMAPSPDIPQLVNLATYLWLPAEQWQRETVSASAGGVTSTVTATPMRVIWDMGQGDTVVCNGPGVPYRPELPDEQQPSDCHFTYRASSAGQPGQAFTVTATVEWETTWAVTGAPGGGSLGTVSRSSSIDVQVAELQSLNVTPLLVAQHGINAAAPGQSADH